MIKFHLAEIRHNKRMTRRLLSQKSGVARSTIEAIEDEHGNPNPSLKTVCKLAKALDVPPYDLFSYSDDGGDDS